MQLVELIHYIFLAIVQGVTEPIPVSSSGHLAIVNAFLETDVDFESLAVISNFGSLIAIIILFRNDLIKLVKSFFGYLSTKKSEYKKEYIYCWLIVLGCIPAGVLGVIVSKLGILDIIADNLKIVGVGLLLTAGFLYWIRNYKGDKSSDEITVKNAFVVGLFQIISLFPGISRSGATITGGLFQGLKRDTAFKYSFMLYIPISIAAMALEMNHLIRAENTHVMWIYYSIVIIVSAVVTYFVTRWFRSIVNKGKLIYFSIYCLIAGLLVVIFM